MHQALLLVRVWLTTFSISPRALTAPWSVDRSKPTSPRPSLIDVSSASAQPGRRHMFVVNNTVVKTCEMRDVSKQQQQQLDFLLGFEAQTSGKRRGVYRKRLPQRHQNVGTREYVS